MRRSSMLIRLCVLVCVLTVAACALPAVASAAPIVYAAPPNVVSDTNPINGTKYWHQGWGNSPRPMVRWQGLTGAAGMLYTVDQTTGTPIATATPALYSHAIFTGEGGGTQMSQTIDLLGVLAFPPMSGWVSPPGATSPLEGEWFLHYRLYGTDDANGAPLFEPRAQFPISYDGTRPNKVANVRITQSPSAAPTGSITTATSRVRIDWQGIDYDALSGTAFFRIYDNGKLIITGDSADGVAAENVAENCVIVPVDDGFPDPATLKQPRGPIWLVPSWTLPYSTWIEDMAPGRHLITVTNVDRAGNESLPSTAAVFISDPDTPTISWVAPTASVLGTSVELQVDAQDAGSITNVTYRLGATVLGTVSTAPYSLSADLSAFANGPQTLSATVTDAMGRTAVANHAFTLDKSLGALATTTETISFPGPGESLGFSSTNPNSGNKFWKRGWGNDLLPDFTITGITGADGVYYKVDRSAANGSININTPAAYSHAVFPTPGGGSVGTHLQHRVDINGVYLVPPPGGWVYSMPGMSDPREGRWYLHEAYYSVDAGTGQASFAPTQTTVQLAIDVTPPSPVTGVLVSPDASVPGSTYTIGAGRRMEIRWNGADYDALSGTAFFRVYIDGALSFTGDSTDGADNVAPDCVVVPVDDSSDPALLERAPLWWVPTWTGGYALTVEDLEAGRHTINVTSVDRAGNESTFGVPAVFVSDPDTPTITWVAPLASTVGTNVPISVEVGDLGAVDRVEYRCDATLLGTSSSAPWGFNADLSAFANGPHVLYATVYDSVGRFATVSHAVTLSAGTVVGPPIGTTDTVVVPDPSGLANPLWFGSSLSNPSTGGKVWRERWGNSLFPDLTIEGVEKAAGIYYYVDRDASSTVDPANLALYSNAVFTPGSGSGGTHLTRTLDINGIYQNPPFAGWLYSVPGMFDPREGDWYMHAAYYAIDPATGQMALAPTQTVSQLRIDMTKPAAVDTVRVTGHPSITPTVTSVGAGQRMGVYWRGAEYDALSGTAFYRIYIDDVLTATGDPDGVDPDTAVSANLVSSPVDDSTPEARVERAPIWFNPGWSQSYGLWIEDLPIGRHTIQVSNVDHAGNEGPKSTAAVYFSDPDTPTVTITTPSGNYVGPSATFGANVVDLAGVRGVGFYVDGVCVGTDTVAPYSVSANMAPFLDGSHTLKVRAVDMFGRVGEASKSITVDKVVPVATSLSNTPNPFYPIRRDRYKDNSTISFRLNKKASCTLYIYDSSGTNVVQTLSKTGVVGANSFVWNGKRSDGTVQVGRYYYRVRVYDGYGSYTQTGLSSTNIKNYEVVKIGRNRVKIVPR